MKKLKKLYFEEKGTNKKGTIIFLHNKLLSNWVWKNQRNNFEGYHCIFLDIPEHGNSYSSGCFSIEKSANLLIEIIKNKSAEGKVNLVGIGLGGQIILKVLVNNSKIVNKAIISGVILRNNTNHENISKKWISILDNTKTILDSKPEKFLVKAYLRYYNLNKTYFNDVKYSLRVITHSSLKRIIHESFNFKISRLNIDNEKNSLGKNLLVLFGEKEYSIVERSSKEIGNIFQNCSIFKVSQANHMWNINKYELFNKIVIEFFNYKDIAALNKECLEKIS